MRSRGLRPAIFLRNLAIRGHCAPPVLDGCVLAPAIGTKDLSSDYNRCRCTQATVRGVRYSDAGLGYGTQRLHRLGHGGRAGRAGHDVVGTRHLSVRGLHASAPSGAQVPAIRADMRDIELGDLRGFDAVIHLAALSNDPLGNLNPQITYDINHLASVRLARAGAEAGVAALPVRLLLQPVRRRRRRRPADGGRRVQPGHAVRRVEGARRARRRAARRRRVQPASSCETPRRTACRRACAPTSSSTASSATRSRRARS